MIVISGSLVLSPGDVPLNTPIIGYQNLVTPGAVMATSEDADHPASNLGNPSTALRWYALPEGSPEGPPAADQYLTVTIDPDNPDDIDYLAIAVHNLGTGENAVSVEGSTGGSPEWFELVEESIQATDDPIVFRFAPQSLTGIRLRIQAGSLIPFVATMFVGKLLVLERGTHSSHIPITMGRATRVMNGMSETGNFLGRVVLSDARKTSFALSKLRKTWYRTNFEPFLVAAQQSPFFFAWKPQEFPNDIGFCTLASDAQGSRDFGTGTMDVTLQLNGVSVR